MCPCNNTKDLIKNEIAITKFELLIQCSKILFHFDSSQKRITEQSQRNKLFKTKEQKTDEMNELSLSKTIKKR